jgi:hypothetical protein
MHWHLIDWYLGLNTHSKWLQQMGTRMAHPVIHREICCCQYQRLLHLHLRVGQQHQHGQLEPKLRSTLMVK